MGTTPIEWTIADVPGEFGPVATLAHECGYVAAVFGGVMRRGYGQDLDILMRPHFDRPQTSVKFALTFGGRCIRRSYNPAAGIESYQVLKGGRIFHFVFGNLRGM